jgi:hypothetical protein
VDTLSPVDQDMAFLDNPSLSPPETTQHYTDSGPQTVVSDLIYFKVPSSALLVA